MPSPSERLRILEQRCAEVVEDLRQVEQMQVDVDSASEQIRLYAREEEEKRKEQLRLLREEREQTRSVHRELQQFVNRVSTDLGKELQLRSKTARAELDRICAEKSLGFPWLENAIARFREVFDLSSARMLAERSRPAKRAAEQVKSMAREKRELLVQMREYRNRVEYYENLFPWLTDYVTEEDIGEVIQAQIGGGEHDIDETDPVRRWLPQAEYDKLSEEDRCQMALERYVQSRSGSAWHAGREYERYIGYRYEQDGYDVTYEGAIKRKADYGRDLLAKKNNQHLVIQCKRWREERTIREKHIQQLFGTTVEYMINELGVAPPWSFDSAAPSQRAQSGMLFGNTRDVEVEPVLEVTTKLSDDALRFADALGITVKITEFDRDYPRIKCNISPDGSKIFHLPMDQMYDRVKIEPHKGEFFAKTVAEATDRGFRRAYRWRGSGDSSGST